MLSKTALHAVRAILALAQQPTEFQGAARLAERLGAPPNYLGKLLQMLAQEGLVVSQKGLRGGFRLARSPSQISVYDVVEPIDRPSRWSGCLLGHPTCSSEAPCALHEQWATVRDTYIGLLQKSTIGDIVASRREDAWLARPRIG